MRILTKPSISKKTVVTIGSICLLIIGVTLFVHYYRLRHQPVVQSTALELYQKGDMKTAAVVVEQELKQDPNNAILLNLQGNVFRDSGKPEAAIASYQLAIKNSPDLLAPRSNLIATYLNLNKKAEAHTALSEALQKFPDQPALVQLKSTLK